MVWGLRSVCLATAAWALSDQAPPWGSWQAPKPKMEWDWFPGAKAGCFVFRRGPPQGLEGAAALPPPRRVYTVFGAS